MQCMQVRSDKQQPWTLFYQQIEGFQFEPGYRYQLTVSRAAHRCAGRCPFPALPAHQGRQQTGGALIKKASFGDACSVHDPVLVRWLTNPLFNQRFRAAMPHHYDQDPHDRTQRLARHHGHSGRVLSPAGSWAHRSHEQQAELAPRLLLGG